MLAYALPFVVVIGAVAVIVPNLVGDDSESSPVFTSTTYSVVYEVLGTGTSEAITYTSGEGNTETTVEKAKLPWRKAMELPVGVTGGTANLIARNPSNDTTVTCRITVAGVPRNEVQATDGYVDPSCAAALPARQAN
ncbi:MAG: MmpS family transport accessory protein [Sporichthyaceae bacterium]